MTKSRHQHRVEVFMQKAGQTVRTQPEIPSEDERELRARLILEEALETIEALGFAVVAHQDTHPSVPFYQNQTVYDLAATKKGPNLIEIADGCADLKVVTTGTLSACGIQDEALQLAVDMSNLKKFGPGGHRREDGKWIKPKDWQPPDIAGVLGIKQEGGGE